MNFDALLAAISDAAPCGEDLSFSTEFDTIQELRRADDPTLDQGDWVTALKVADWPGVVRQCEQLLSTRSKDLRVAAWWTEASARLRGFAGLADGLQLCTSLCERHWDELHPRIEDGDMEQRDGNLRWLLTQVEVLVPQLTVLRHAGRDYALRDIASVQARTAERASEAGAVAGGVTADDIAAARRGTGREFLGSNLGDAQRASQALSRLQQVIDARMGAEGPGFAAARRALEEALHGIERLGRDATPVAAAAVSPGAAAAVPPELADMAAGPLRTRAEALQQLRAVAAFFRATEPHSPVAYLAERAAQWGDMPLHDWLRAVVKDEGVLANMEELLGVAPPPVPAD